MNVSPAQQGKHINGALAMELAGGTRGVVFVAVCA